MCIIDNILSLLSKKKVNQVDLCKYIGVSTSTMTNWKVRKTDPPARYIIPICEYLNVSPELLLTGEENNNYNYVLSSDEASLLAAYNSVGELSQSLIIERASALAELESAKKKGAVQIHLKQSSKQTETEEQVGPEYISLPFPALPASAGAGEYLHEDTTSYIKVPATNLTGRASFALRVHGDSMEPAYFDGDIVLVAADADVNIGDIGIFIVNGEGFIKQRGKDRLISLNNRYKDIKIGSSDNCICKGKVIGSL